MKDQVPSERHAQLNKLGRQLSVIRNLLIALIIGVVVIAIAIRINPAVPLSEFCIVVLLYLIVPLAILYLFVSIVGVVYRRQKRKQYETARFRELSGQ